MPIQLIISLVGIIIWLLLLPLKCCCCPLAWLVQCIADVMEWLIKAPIRGVMWMVGSPWQPAAAAGDVESGAAVPK